MHIGLLQKTLHEVIQHEISADIGSTERRACIATAQASLRNASMVVRGVVRDYPVAIVAGEMWEPGDPLPCSRCEKRSTNYVVSAEGFVLCMRCVPKERLVMR